MPAFSLAILDFDGTLADSFSWFCSVLDQTTDRFGLRRVDPERIESMRDHSSRDVIAALGVPAWKLPAIATYMRGLFAEGLADIRLFAGASDLLAELRRAGLKLALVSSNAESNVRAVLGPAARLVDHFACGTSLWGKSGKFRAALRAVHVSASEGIGIGDEVRDIEAARGVRLAAGAVTFGYNSRKALVAAGPDYLFDSYEAILGTLTRPRLVPGHPAELGGHVLPLR